jgi:hypothetical protein
MAAWRQRTLLDFPTLLTVRLLTSRIMCVNICELAWKKVEGEVVIIKYDRKNSGKTAAVKN